MKLKDGRKHVYMKDKIKGSHFSGRVTVKGEETYERTIVNSGHTLGGHKVRFIQVKGRSRVGQAAVIES